MCIRDRSKFGLGLLAIREDEDAAEVMGVVAPSAKTWAYVPVSYTHLTLPTSDLV